MQRFLSAWRPLLGLGLSLLAAALCLGLLARSVLAYQAQQRGIELTAAPHSPRLGANVDWLAVDDAEIARQAEAARAAGLGHVRQRLAWADVEPTPDGYQ